MPNSYISMRAGFDAERTVTGPFTGVAQNLGAVLSNNPVIMIFDNQSTVDVVVGIDGVAWKTFPAGEALVLDMRGNHGTASTFTVDIGSQFTVTATAGTGNFSLAIIYAK